MEQGSYFKGSITRGRWQPRLMQRHSQSRRLSPSYYLPDAEQRFEDDGMLLDEPSLSEPVIDQEYVASEQAIEDYSERGLPSGYYQQPAPAQRSHYSNSQVQYASHPPSGGYNLSPDALGQMLARLRPVSNLQSWSPPIQARRKPLADPEPDDELSARDYFGTDGVVATPPPAVVPFQSVHQHGNQEHRPPQGNRLVQGIELISTRQLPDRYRMVFPFSNFNAVQSKCFNTVFGTNENFVLSSPTGSGKTAIFELAICRLMNHLPLGQFKIVYQAPTKSLCAERYRDWQKKFSQFDMKCAELTGDTEQGQLKLVQHASIILTTPEKWDSVTRKWKDHARLMQLIRLFLIDEVHMLKEERGATLEAVVSRMKSVGPDVRFIALSATVPNSDDIAIWLGRDSANQHLPAARECFGEEFRPVKLQKYVCGYPTNSNDFVLDRTLDTKLPDVIAKYSQRKPIMVFCPTRRSTQNTARALANWWSTKGPRDRYWAPPRQQIAVHDTDLQHCISSAVAFHHAGLGFEDREVVEKGYLHGNIKVICCTSTLAVGVNLPCHLVIIKNTVSYSNVGMKEYSDLDIMQMLGRAGRPQFDSSAVAVIMTRQEKVRKYELMMSGQEILESCLHINLIEHLNAEIGLGTINSLTSAKKWLSGTFLYVRLQANPGHYRLEGDSSTNANLDETLEQICVKDISLLQEYRLVSGERQLMATEFGDAMARYCVKFETAKTFLELRNKAKLSEILSAISQAAEFKEIRFRSGEKQPYKMLNQSSQIKFPIPVHLDASAHKASLIIQAQLGGVDLPVSNDDKGRRIKHQHNTDVYIIFQAVHRLIRCMIDFQVTLEDSVSLRNALTLCRSLGANCWDDSPLQLRQLEGIGPAGVRKLVSIGVRTIEELEATEPHKIEMVLGRNKPFGNKLLAMTNLFPKLRVSVQVVGRPIIQAKHGATIHGKAEVGFMNDSPPLAFRGKAVFVIFLVETSDGHKVTFGRLSAKKIGNGLDIKFTAHLRSPNQSINCYVMCDEFAGTLRSASLKPTIPSIAWPVDLPEQTMVAKTVPEMLRPSMNMAKKRGESASYQEQRDEYDDDHIRDDEMIRAAAVSDPEFRNIDDLLPESTPATSKCATGTKTADQDWEPNRLPNGKWSCNHSCKDKHRCKHLCCREGLDRPPKPPKKHVLSGMESGSSLTKKAQEADKLPKGQMQLQLPSMESNKGLASMASSLPLVDLTHDAKGGRSRTASSQLQMPKRLERPSFRFRDDENTPPSRSSHPERPRGAPAASYQFPAGRSDMVKALDGSGDRPDSVSTIPMVNKTRFCRDPLPYEPSTDELLALIADSPAKPRDAGFSDALSMREDVALQYAQEGGHQMKDIAEDITAIKPPNHLPSITPNSPSTGPLRTISGNGKMSKCSNVFANEPVKADTSPKALLIQSSMDETADASSEALFVQDTPMKACKKRVGIYGGKTHDSTMHSSAKRLKVTYGFARKTISIHTRSTLGDALEGKEPTRATQDIENEPAGPKELDPWLLQEFGKYIEFV